MISACPSLRGPAAACLLAAFALALALALAAPMPAAASPERAEAFAEDAQRLAAGLPGWGAAEGGAPSLDAFAREAEALGGWIDRSGKAADLGCIFRGMAEEARSQSARMAAADPAERALARERLGLLFEDAAHIAAEAAAAARSEVRLPDVAPACEGAALPEAGDLGAALE